VRPARLVRRRPGALVFTPSASNALYGRRWRRHYGAASLIDTISLLRSGRRDWHRGRRGHSLEWRALRHSHRHRPCLAWALSRCNARHCAPRPTAARCHWRHSPKRRLHLACMPICSLARLLLSSEAATDATGDATGGRGLGPCTVRPPGERSSDLMAGAPHALAVLTVLVVALIPAGTFTHAVLTVPLLVLLVLLHLLHVRLLLARMLLLLVLLHVLHVLHVLLHVHLQKVLMLLLLLRSQTGNTVRFSFLKGTSTSA
jgi:hypothetical protein